MKNNELQGILYDSEGKPIREPLVRDEVKVICTPFNTHSTAGNGQVTDCQKIKLPMPREFNGKKYYGAADVAKIIGVSKKCTYFCRKLSNSFCCIF